VNLLENANKYSPASSTVTLRADRIGGDLLISVLDRGPGVDAAERDRIFTPFYRAPDAPPDVGSAGLGLSIARRLAEVQGGALRYEVRVGGGSVFTLVLPAAELDDAVAGGAVFTNR
jgi:two-component system sensor histidine kinase KdpD